MRKLRAKYQAHVATMLKLAGFSDADARAAQDHRTRARNCEELIAACRRTKTSIKRTTPGLARIFRRRLRDLTGPNTFAELASMRLTSFTVWQPEAFKGEAALVASTPLDTWKDWLAFHRIEACRSPSESVRTGKIRIFRQGAVRGGDSNVPAGSAAYLW